MIDYILEQAAQDLKDCDISFVRHNGMPHILGFKQSSTDSYWFEQLMLTHAKDKKIAGILSELSERLYLLPVHVTPKSKVVCDFLVET